VAIKNVGISPEPLAKSTFQREVFATLFGFHLSHSLVKVFGPEPKSGCSFMVFLATSIVAEKEGWISVFETLKVFEIKDKTGRVIYLSYERWRKHILVEHPYLANKVEEIK